MEDINCGLFVQQDPLRRHSCDSITCREHCLSWWRNWKSNDVWSNPPLSTAAIWSVAPLCRFPFDASAAAVVLLPVAHGVGVISPRESSDELHSHA